MQSFLALWLGGVQNERQPLPPSPVEFQIDRGETLPGSTGLHSRILAPFLAFTQTVAPT